MFHFLEGVPSMEIFKQWGKLLIDCFIALLFELLKQKYVQILFTERLEDYTILLILFIISSMYVCMYVHRICIYMYL